MGHIFKFQYRPLKHKGEKNTQNEAHSYRGFIEKVWQSEAGNKIMTVGQINIHNEVNYRNFDMERVENMEKITN